MLLPFLFWQLFFLNLENQIQSLPVLAVRQGSFFLNHITNYYMEIAIIVFGIRFAFSSY